MESLEFIQSKHFNTFECLTGHFQLRWKNNVIIDDSANEDLYEKYLAIDIFNDWINNNNIWQEYQLYLHGEEDICFQRIITAIDDDEAEKIAKKILLESTSDIEYIEIVDWQINYVNEVYRNE